ncbi:MAG: hypothetical protein U0V72_09895 [Cytophagales bacterium]
MFKNTFLYCYILIFTNLVAQQTISDTVFLKYLKSNFPQVIENGSNLNTNAAANITDTINISGLGIENISEIQYFTQIKVLDASNNKINLLPEISSLTTLVDLNISGNQISVLPDLSSLSTITQLNISRNKLTDISTVNTLNNLQYLNASYNLIKIFPNIANCKKLEILDLSYNNITEINTQISNAKLTSLALNNNDITTIPNIDNLTNLTELELSYNNLINIPSLGTLTKLIEIYLNNNLLTSLPNNCFPLVLKNLRLEKNLFSFEDLIPYSTKIQNFETVVKYAPQNIKTTTTNITVKLNRDFILKTDLDTAVNNINYSWTKNNLSFKTGYIQKIASLQYADSGLYTVTLTHTLLPKLSITPTTYKINVINCLQKSLLSYTSEPIECLKKGSLSIVNNNEDTCTYVLVSLFNNDTTYTSLPKFTNLVYPSYKLIIQDSYKCQISIDSIMLPIEPCKEIVITPNQDQIDDEYYFEESGNWKIYDKNNKLIAELIAPCIWDGKINNERLPIGYYTAYLEKNKIKKGITIAY